MSIHQKKLTRGVFRYTLFPDTNRLIRDSSLFEPGTTLTLGQVEEYVYEGSKVKVFRVTSFLLPRAEPGKPREERACAARTFVVVRELNASLMPEFA